MPVTQKTGQVATAAVNEVTGSRLVSKAPSDAYKDGWDRIFGKKREAEPPTPEQPNQGEDF